MLLKFKVINQLITRLDNLQPVADSSNYLKLQFSFSNDWAEGAKIVIFNGSQSVSMESDWCYVPEEVLKKATSFTISIYQGDRITTNVATVKVLPSGYVDGLTPNAPTLQDIINYASSRPNKALAGSVVEYTLPPLVQPGAVHPPVFEGIETIKIREGGASSNISFVNFLPKTFVSPISIYVLDFTGNKVSDAFQISIKANSSSVNFPTWYFPELERCHNLFIAGGDGYYTKVVFGQNINHIGTLPNKNSYTYCFPFSQAEAPAGYPWGAPNANFIWNYDF